MIIYYRISDGSYKKDRMTTKKNCLVNYFNCFNPIADVTIIIADRCGEQTTKMIHDVISDHIEFRGCDITVVNTDIGHGAGTWRIAAEMALEQKENTLVYFLEDDYLHLPESRNGLVDGIKYADYISLYDHNDKYINVQNGGNPFVTDGGEVTRVISTQTSHWKLTNSTTMTFATMSDTLRHDWSVWDKWTNQPHPNDFSAFLELRNNGKTLITPIPGLSTHCEQQWASPHIKWENYIYTPKRQNNDKR